MVPVHDDLVVGAIDSARTIISRPGDDRTGLRGLPPTPSPMQIGRANPVAAHHSLTRFGAVPPAAIGLAAGLFTSAAVIALSAAGQATPVRPEIDALLGGVTGLFAAVLQAFVILAQWTPVPNQYITPPSLLLIALMTAFFYVPVYAVAGAAGAILRERLHASPCPAERESRPSGRQWTGIAAGALIIAVPLALSVVVGPRYGLLADGNTLTALFLASAFIGGFVAGVLSSGGARAGAGSALLSGVFGLGVLALYFIRQASTATGDTVPAGLWPIAFMILGSWVLPSAVVSGALGGSFRRPAGASPEPEL